MGKYLTTSLNLDTRGRTKRDLPWTTTEREYSACADLLVDPSPRRLFLLLERLERGRLRRERGVRRHRLTRRRRERRACIQAVRNHVLLRFLLLFLLLFLIFFFLLFAILAPSPVEGGAIGVPDSVLTQKVRETVPALLLVHETLLLLVKASETRFLPPSIPSKLRGLRGSWAFLVLLHHRQTCPIEYTSHISAHHSRNVALNTLLI